MSKARRSPYAFEPCWCCGSDTICCCPQDWAKCKECGRCDVHHKDNCGYSNWCREWRVEYSWEAYQNWKKQQEATP